VAAFILPKAKQKTLPLEEAPYNSWVEGDKNRNKLFTRSAFITTH
jgi:hypothetical protein